MTRLETSPVTLLEINCPKDRRNIRIHDCVLSKCPYENGHTISHGSSYVNCDYPKAQVPAKILSKMANQARTLSNDLKKAGYASQAELLEPVIRSLVTAALDAMNSEAGS
jgi:hypothetical protein